MHGAVGPLLLGDQLGLGLEAYEVLHVELVVVGCLLRHLDAELEPQQLLGPALGVQVVERRHGARLPAPLEAAAPEGHLQAVDRDEEGVVAGAKSSGNGA